MTSRGTVKTRVFKDTAIYSVANYIAQGIGVINSIILRQFMGPQAMGVWSVLQVILGYCGYASMGTTRAMARDYPLLRGRGDFEKAEKMKNLTLTFSMVMSIIPALLLAGYAIFKSGSLERSFLIGILFLVFFLFIQRFYDFVLTLLRTEKKFNLLSGIVVINAVVGLIVTLTFVKFWNIYGLLAGTFVTTMLLIFVIFRYDAYDFKFFWHLPSIWSELKLGVPLVGSAFLLTILSGIDKLIIAKKLGFYDAGLYSIAMMCSNYIFTLPMMFSHVVYPNLMESFGKTGDSRQVLGYLTKPILVFSVMVPFFCGLAIFLMPIITQLFLPKFIPGLPAMAIYLIGIYFMLMGQFANNYLVALDKYLITIPILGVAIAINYFLGLFLIHLGWGISGVALSTVFAYAAYGIMTFIAALLKAMTPRESVITILENLALFILYFTGILFLDRYLKLDNLYMTAGLKCFGLVLYALPFCRILEKKTGVISTLLLTKKIHFEKNPELDDQGA
ncbi:MAG TPA: oligosaccharide flippase family protein [Candidatus Omnitrophota bacterium]|nr:oligosaccharide flippase family protein [Candidatus Omnitrophota bacterium]